MKAAHVVAWIALAFLALACVVFQIRRDVAFFRHSDPVCGCGNPRCAIAEAERCSCCSPAPCLNPSRVR